MLQKIIHRIIRMKKLSIFSFWKIKMHSLRIRSLQEMRILIWKRNRWVIFFPQDRKILWWWMTWQVSGDTRLLSWIQFHSISFSRRKSLNLKNWIMGMEMEHYKEEFNIRLLMNLKKDRNWTQSKTFTHKHCSLSDNYLAIISSARWKKSKAVWSTPNKQLTFLVASYKNKCMKSQVGSFLLPPKQTRRERYKSRSKQFSQCRSIRFNHNWLKSLKGLLLKIRSMIMIFCPGRITIWCMLRIIWLRFISSSFQIRNL